MRKLLLPVVAFAAAALAACSSSETQSTQSSTTSSSTTTSSKVNTQTSSPASSSVTSESIVTSEQATTAGGYYPGDPRLIPINTVSDTVGTFLTEDASDPSGKYYVFCNGGTLTKEQGVPVESGTCSELSTWDEVGTMSEQFGTVLLVEAEKAFSEAESEIFSEMEASGYPTPIQEPSPWVSGQIEWQNCIDAGNSTEYCRETLN
ncbi:hypothetical protein ACMG4H_14360 [Corynebacterium glutamicum]|uniref:hypothetical protein n=1 Tax=Corynebacterium glutamicum TaxID=1718 RepID=UPI003C7AF96F